MATKTRSVAELDPDQLTDSDRLYHMAQAMRDEDDLFELPVVDWKTKGEAVLVEIVTPDGTTATVQQDWPDKPTEDNDFIRTCMCALDIDDPKSAALMADELQDVNHDEFTVPADRNEDEWELKPEADMPESLRSSLRTDEDASSVSTSWKIVAIAGGPLALLAGIFDTKKNVDWDDETPAAENYWNVQTFIFGSLGTVLWIIPLLLL